MTLHPAPTPRGRGRAAAVGLVPLLAVALVLSGCGGTAGGPGVVTLADPSATADPSSSPAASVDPEQAMLDFQACMKEHGVDVQVSIAGDGQGGSDAGPGTVEVHGEAPPPGELQPGTAPDKDGLKAADEACRHLLPQGGQGDANATIDPDLADQLLKFSQCMRDQGIDFPDPEFSGGGVTIGIGPGEDGKGVDPNSEAFKSAQEACGKDLPGGGPFTVGGGTGPAPQATP